MSTKHLVAALLLAVAVGVGLDLPVQADQASNMPTDPSITSAEVSP